MSSRYVPMLACFLVLVALLGGTAEAGAAVQLHGDWPSGERVTLSLKEVPRADAVRALAEKAGWNLVSEGLGTAPVTVEVKDEAPGRLLSLLLASGEFEVERKDGLVTIRPALATELASMTPPSPANSANVRTSVPSLEPVAHSAGDDIAVVGDVTIGPKDSVGDVIVWRGRALILGEVRGSVVVFGGGALLKGTARVDRDLIAFGGDVAIENGARVGGDVAPVFGTLRRGSEVSVKCTTCNEKEPMTFAKYGRESAERFVGIAILWLVGAAALGLAYRRVEVLRREILNRPAQSLGVGTLAAIAVLALTGALFITLIGIPIAILLWIVLGSAVYVAASVPLLALGERILRSKTKNPYAHLAAGCGALALGSLVPFLPGVLYVALTLVALGALFATRGAGLFVNRLKR